MNERTNERKNERTIEYIMEDTIGFVDLDPLIPEGLIVMS